MQCTVLKTDIFTENSKKTFWYDHYTLYWPARLIFFYWNQLFSFVLQYSFVALATQLVKLVCKSTLKYVFLWMEWICYKYYSPCNGILYKVKLRQIFKNFKLKNFHSSCILRPIIFTICYCYNFTALFTLLFVVVIMQRS